MTSTSDERPISLRLVRMALPLVAYGLIQVFVSANDALLLGGTGATAMASAAAASAVAMVSVLFFSGLGGTATQILVSRADDGDGPLITGRAIRLTLLIGLPALVVLCLAAPTLLSAVGGTAVDAPLAATMLRITAPGLLASAVGSAVRGYASGLGRTRVVMGASATAAIVDIVLSIGLLSLGLGPLAVSIGTSAGMTVSAAVLVVWLARQDGHIGRRCLHETFRPTLNGLGENWRVGWPEALLGMFSAGAGVVVTLLLSEYPAAELAASRTLEAATALAWTVLSATGTAGLTLLGRALGRDGPEARSSFLRALTALAVVVGTAAGLLLVLGPLLTELYLRTTFTEAVAERARSVMFLAWSQVLWIALDQVLLGICRSHTNTRASLVSSLVAEYAVFLPIGWLLCRTLELGLTGLFIAHHLYWAAFCLVLAVPAARHLRRLSRGPASSDRSPAGP